MAGRSKRPQLKLSAEEIEQLERLRDSRTVPWREAQRARIVLRYHSGETIAQIARAVGMTRKSVGKWVAKALAMGAGAALKDTFHRPKAPVITDDAKAGVVHLACSKPKDFGYAAEVWTRSALARHVRQYAQEEGYPSLARAAKATVQRILAEQTTASGETEVLSGAARPGFRSAHMTGQETFVNYKTLLNEP